MNDIEQVRYVLGQYRTIAVVGLSPQWHRPSFFTAKYMQEHGYRIIPVNPKADYILGEPCYASLLDVPEPIGIVDVFRKTEDVPEIAQQAIQVGAKVLWQQLGVLNHQAHEKAQAAGLTGVMDRCVKIEHARLFGGLNWVGVNTGVISAKRASPAPRW
jgi:uncharacterized protein